MLKYGDIIANFDPLCEVLNRVIFCGRVTTAEKEVLMFIYLKKLSDGSILCTPKGSGQPEWFTYKNEDYEIFYLDTIASEGKIDVKSYSFRLALLGGLEIKTGKPFVHEIDDTEVIDSEEIPELPPAKH